MQTRVWPTAVVFAVLLLGAVANLAGEEARSSAKFLGSASCQSSGCHGGAGPERNQFLMWSEKDYHSRASAILATSRSTQMAASLKIGDATASARCTVCHSPLQALPADMLRISARPDEGVSCESCHGAAEPWLRSHTRRDFTYQSRVAAGMRDLKSIYVRANSCVACHETISRDLLDAGHPELIFELDGMTETELPHWKDAGEWFGPRAWLTGQAVALREESWQPNTSATASARWKALAWLLQKVTEVVDGVPRITAVANPTKSDFSTMQESSDQLARQTAKWSCSKAATEKLLIELAGCAPEFAASADVNEQCHRAKVLVLALDRLCAALKQNGKPMPEAEQSLTVLFADTKQAEAFDARRFASHLTDFQRTLSP